VVPVLNLRLLIVLIYFVVFLNLFKRIPGKKLGLGSIPVAVQSKDYVCSRLIAAIVGSNPVEGVDVCLLYLLCVM